MSQTITAYHEDGIEMQNRRASLGKLRAEHNQTTNVFNARAAMTGGAALLVWTLTSDAAQVIFGLVGIVTGVQSAYYKTCQLLVRKQIADIEKIPVATYRVIKPR